MSYRHRLPAAVAAALLSLSALGGVAAATSASAAPVAAAANGPASGWKPRGESFAGTVTTTDVKLPMSDGVTLKGDLVLPAGASGAAAPGRFPVIVEITAYNKTAIMSGGGGLAGGDPAYLVKRGYAFLLVDARGTGTSPGTWQVFGDREQQDAAEVVTWASNQSWSNGNVGMVGASYMGISQLFAAGRHPKGLKAIFPQVPGADVYRDIVASGGQLDIGFMPLWLGLVNGTGYIPSPTQDGATGALTQILEHIGGTGATTTELAASALLGGDRAYDGPWYRERSPIEKAVPAVTVPTFLVGGEYDLFQRGTSMIFQNLRERGVPVKMILGPWDHLQGSSAAEIGDAGYGTLDELWLRWFDRYVRGVADPALDSDIPNFTYRQLGSDQWVRRDGYLDSQRATTLQLSGSAVPTLKKGALTAGAGAPGTATLAPIPLSGLCTRSSSQWTAGVSGVLGLGSNPCNVDNRANDLSAVVYETAPLEQDLRILGPINVRLYASSPTGDGMVSVHVSRVAADGRVDRLTGGWQVLSLAELDQARSLKIGNTIIRPWHPYTKASQRNLAAGEVRPVDVEVFPTGAIIPAGQRLRVSINAFDLPHLAPHLGVLTSALSTVTLHTGGQYPAHIALPTLSGNGVSAAGGTTPAGVTGLVGDLTGQITGGAGTAIPGTDTLDQALDPAYDATGAAVDALARGASGDGAVSAATTPASSPIASLATQPSGLAVLGALGVLLLLITRGWVRARA